MTVFSQGYGPEFDGNSILVHIKGCEYAYIGSKFYLFETDTPIVKYVSEVGNNDVPYPYAVDERGRFYLMVENVVLNKLDHPRPIHTALSTKSRTTSMLIFLGTHTCR